MSQTSPTVHALIQAQAAQRPDAIYARDSESSAALSFADLARSCRQMAALLHAQGSRPGETVSVIMPNGLQTVRILLGAMHGGWCVNPVNLLSQTEQMRYVLEHSDCTVVIASPDWADRVKAILATIARPIALLVLDPVIDQLPTAEMQVAPPSADALALLMYTSGTTGVPKGVMLTQSNLAANAQAISAEHALGPEDCVLAVLPLYHINAFAVVMLAPLAHGGSLVMTPKFSAARFWRQAVEGGCTWINVVPTMISYLLEGQAPAAGATAKIRFCRSASAALPPDYLQSFESRFGIGIIETMGLTETVAPSFSNPLARDQRKLGSVGKASGCEACILDAQLQPVADGETGELAIRGPNVMRGYYKNEKATRDAFTPDGWLRTGDLGHRDSDGFFFVTGRIKELIIKGGENIAPREIDEVLLRHPAILDAAVVGMPDRHYGQEIMACIVPREGHQLDEAGVTEFCREHLGPYKTPKVIYFVKELPRGPSGKVQRLKMLDLPECQATAT